MRTLTVAVILLGGTASAAPQSKPTLEHGDATVSGDLDATVLAKVVKRSSAKLLGCYKKLLVTQPGLSGTATVTFTIGADGKVTTADTVGLTASAGACIGATITKIRFAKPKDGQPVKVTYPLTFEPGPTGTGAFASLTGTGDIGTGSDENAIYGGLIGNEAGEMNGGYEFGKSGFGPGGGGTGWGTIGTGRYGTIGKGGGTGGGGMRGRTSDVPMVSIGQPAVQGDLDKAIIRRYIKRNIQKLQYCYEKELLDKPTLKGTVTADFTIGVDGIVSASTATGLGNTNVESCIANVIKGIEFPKPKGNGPVTVKYPFMFKPADPPAKK